MCTIGYTPAMAKDSDYRIRIQRDLRDRFLEICRAEDTPAAQVIREFMREHIERQEDGCPGTQSTPEVGADG